MRMYSKSFVKRINMIIIPMIMFIVCFCGSLAYTIKSYNNIYSFYTQKNYRLTNLVVKLNEFAKYYDDYTVLHSDGSYSKLIECYEGSLKDTVTELYYNRLDYGKVNANEIEKVNDTITKDFSSILSTITVDFDNSHRMMLLTLADVYNRVNGVESTYIEENNEKFIEQKSGLYLCETIMIGSFIAFVGFACYLFIFLKTKVVKPIEDISGWAKLFKDNYTEMANIQYDGKYTEIANLADSFNIVKLKLIQANTLKKENETVLRKLKDEEEYKKKFVKQLYDEKREKESISLEAKRDGLTGLYNRRSFDSLVDDFVGNKPASMEGALFLIDMDNFKNVNDTLGHLAGDEALKTLAGAMRVVFPGGYLGRYGGDEFIAFITGVSSDEELAELGNSLCKKMDKDFVYGDISVKISVSIGVSNTVGLDDYAELYMRADKALYYSKEHGRNQCTLSSQLNE